MNETTMARRAREWVVEWVKECYIAIRYQLPKWWCTTKGERRGE